MAKRKRGELPTPAEATVEMGLKDGWIVLDIKHDYRSASTKKNGKMKATFVMLMNTRTGEKTNWMHKFTARKKYGVEDKTRRKGLYKHTNDSINEKIKELTNGNAELVKWEHNDKGHIIADIKFIECNHIIENKTLAKNVFDCEECPYCSPKWKTENAVCTLIEENAPKLEDKDIKIKTNRQKTVHMKLKTGEEFDRRFDMVIEISHREDETVKRWVVVEYNGEQHYRPVNFGNLSEEELQKAFEGNKLRDAQKRAFCKRWNIPLIVIPYWEKANIEEIIKTQVRDAIWEESFNVVHIHFQNQCLTT